MDKVQGKSQIVNEESIQLMDNVWTKKLLIRNFRAIYTRATGPKPNPNILSSKLDANKKCLKRTRSINLVNFAVWRESKTVLRRKACIPQRLTDSQKTL